MQDVLPPQDTRSIRKIPVPPGRKKAPVAPPPQAPDMEEYVEERRPRRGSLLLWTIAGVILCSLAGLLLASFFEGATVTVYPREQSVTLEGTLSAAPDAPIGSLAYQTVTVSREASRTVAASGTATVERRASGQITIYNAYSKESQRLIKNTRFESSDGRIYRIGDSVTVPGAVTGADQSVRPGEITVTVSADSPGPSYNQGLTTFTIPGFKGDPRFEKFTAKSVSPMTGGFVGQERVVSDADLAEATSAMQNELAGALTQALTAELPAGYLLVSGSASPTFESLPQGEGEDGTALLTMKGTASAAVVREKDLAAEIAKLEVEGYQGEALLFADPTTVALSVERAPSNLGEGSIAISLAGEPSLVWQFDEKALQNALAGKDRGAFDTVIEAFKPAISRADASIRPFFKGSFPSNPESITITTESR